MSYLEDFMLLSGTIKESKHSISLPNSGVNVQWFPFVSNQNYIGELKGESPEYLNLILNNSVAENMVFNYPVFYTDNSSNNEVILFFHGLNERKWDKYWPWAKYLCETTGKTVVLFPIAYHQNRSPEAWSNPRFMRTIIENPNIKKSHPKGLSFANAALSIRLTHSPEQFFISGAQSYNDVVTLIDDIKAGRHPLLSPKANFNLFGYSIGAFLSEVLLLRNPKKYFTQSKAFFFCGGATLNNIYGNNKFIFDQSTQEALNGFISNPIQLNKFFSLRKHASLKSVYKSFLDLSKDVSRARDNMVKKYKDRIKVVSMVKDLVIPHQHIVAALNIPKHKNLIPVEAYDYDVPYSHENPFPLIPKYQDQVKNAFTDIFNEASAFLK